MIKRRRLPPVAYALALCIGLNACAGGGTGATGTTAAALPAAAGSTSAISGERVAAASAISPEKRAGFLGAFFRAVGPTEYGVFSSTAKQVTPNPYPSPRTSLFGSGGYCDAVAANGVSISSGLVVDSAKITNIYNLGVRWTRSTISAEFTDDSQLYGAGHYSFGEMDSAQCAAIRYNITPEIDIEAGPVVYNELPGGWLPVQFPNYKTAADFGSYCGAVAKHETQTFTSVRRYSIPGNEVNSNPALFPGGAAQIAAFTKACYSAIKAAQPDSTVYAFELNMSAGAAAFVKAQYALGCKIGTCYDALAMHMYMPYPLPATTAPCVPNSGGTYSQHCITDLQIAAQDPTMHVIVSEAEFMVPSTVPNEATKATAVTEMMTQFSQNPDVDGVSYANVDECSVYPTGYFSGACLISKTGTALPAYSALQWQAAQEFL